MFSHELIKEASFWKDFVAGADPTQTLAFESGIENRDNHKKHLRNLSAGAFAAGGLINVPQIGFAGGFLGAMGRRPAGTPWGRYALGTGMKEGLRGAGSMFKNLASPALRGPGRAKFLGAAAAFAGGGVLQAALQTNQYRLGQRARKRIEEEKEDRTRQGFVRRLSGLLPGKGKQP
jgi:hypothetical protein